MQRNARTDKAQRRLRVKDRSCRPCEKTRSTAVDVACKRKISYCTYKQKYHKGITGYAEIVQCHAIKVWVDVTARNPPLKRVLNVLGRFPKVLPQLADMRPDAFGHGDVGKCFEVVVTITADL